MNFDYSASPVAVRDDLGSLFEATWVGLARPGNGWHGEDKVLIAEATRAARSDRGRPTVSGLGAVTDEVVWLLANAPADASQAWVRRAVADLGVVRYLEVIGWGSMVIAIDTFNSLLGEPLAELPGPEDGDPKPVGRVPKLKDRSAWVPTTGLPIPRLALSAVPATQDMANMLIDRLYIEPEQSRDVGLIRGLTPVQLELVATAVSHGNRCFYCTLGHLVMLQRTAASSGAALDTLGIVDSSVDVHVAGGSELLELSRSAIQPTPDPTKLAFVADVLGDQAALTAAEVAAGFMMINRLVEMTGQPAMTRQRERMRSVIEPLGILEFPHSGLSIDRPKPSIARRVIRKISG